MCFHKSFSDLFLAVWFSFFFLIFFIIIIIFSLSNFLLLCDNSYFVVVVVISFFVPLSSSCFSISLYFPNTFCLTTQHCEKIFFGINSWGKTELRGKTLKWFIAAAVWRAKKRFYIVFLIFSFGKNFD